jgi:HAD superfamily hydrolase (TIGR01509 family)
VNSFRAVLFDAGDTLIRLAGSGETLLRRAAASLGHDRPDPAHVAQVWRRVLDRSSSAAELAKGRDLSLARHREVWTALYTAAGSEELVPGLAAALYELTVRADSWEAFPDTLPTLRAVRERGLQTAVISDTGFDLRPALDRLGITPYLDTVVMSYEQGICKPDAKAFLVACDRLRVEPAHAVMVGDNPLTDSGAVTAGICVLLLPPPPRTGPRGLGRLLPRL